MCQEYQKFLPTLMQQELEQIPLSAEYATMMMHIIFCPHCTAEYAILKELNTMTGSEMAHFPRPDLSFLAPAWKPVHDWLYQLRQEGNRIVQVILRLSENMSPPVALTPLAVKGNMHTASQREIVRQVNLTPVDTEDLDIEAVIWKQRDDPMHYALTVRVQIPSRWPDLQGTEVSATAAEWHADGTTDSEGMVQFEGLPAALLNHLHITISS